MDLHALLKRVQSITRDFSGSIFRYDDVVNYINEGIERVQQVIPACEGMVLLAKDSDKPILLPARYHHLLSVYSASRCFAQDERHYQAGTLMNEFEQKLEELRSKIENGDVVIVDDSGAPIQSAWVEDYVVDNYFTKRTSTVDLDNGAEEE